MDVQCILHVVDERAYGGSKSSVYCFVVDEKACGRRKQTVVHRMICGRRKPYGCTQISSYLFIVEKKDTLLYSTPNSTDKLCAIRRGIN